MKVRSHGETDRHAHRSYSPLFVHKKHNCCEAGDQKSGDDGNDDDQVEGDIVVSCGGENTVSASSPCFPSASKSSGVSQTLSYVWAAARRKTCSRSRSCFLPGRWRALEQSSSPVPGWSAGPPCAPGSAAAAHTCASPAGGEKTSVWSKPARADCLKITFILCFSDQRRETTDGSSLDKWNSLN